MSMKQITEFSQAEKEGEFELKVMVFDITEEEFKTIRGELDSLSFRYQHIEADSLNANLTGSYDAVIAAMKQLEEKGYIW